MSPSDYFIYREQNRTMQDIGMYSGDSVSVTGVAEPEQVPALRVTDGTLPLLGIPPLLGRSFTKQDDSPGAPETVMLTTAIGAANLAATPPRSAATSSSMQKPANHRRPAAAISFLDRDDPALITPFQFDRSKVNSATSATTVSPG